ncbi:hypothetical protein BofuT4_uP045330.1 [Botrytis cinerea T4]|uniref:Uncharacterized protein n=1 Tax=Botryotinia fuckeliana (strain T4) TaxID=999810 RepID=G2XYH8_BOTF4|nr:hypothetical protein BofuT4_uP045330.1 [Botrytis cinerea T4]
MVHAVLLNSAPVSSKAFNQRHTQRLAEELEKIHRLVLKELIGRSRFPSEIHHQPITQPIILKARISLPIDLAGLVLVV